MASDYDDLAFERIINVPKKGIGEKTIRSIEVFGRKKNLSLMQATRSLVTINYFTKTIMDLMSTLIPTRRHMIVKVFFTNIFPFNLDK